MFSYCCIPIRTTSRGASPCLLGTPAVPVHDLAQRRLRPLGSLGAACPSRPPLLHAHAVLRLLLERPHRVVPSIELRLVPGRLHRRHACRRRQRIPGRRSHPFSS
ncbi:unnamed protein product, partial [Musa acuminata subsp. burmannicoides]